MRCVRSHRSLLAAALGILFVSAMVANAQTVRIIYYSGNVSVISGSERQKARLGQKLAASDRVKIGSEASVQLSIDGKVLRYSSPTTLKVSDAIARAGRSQNSVVANSARTLAGASGAGRSDRRSVAGATRASGGKAGAVDSLQTEALNTGTVRLNNKVESMTGLEDPVGLFRQAAEEIKSEALVILQPRSTAVTDGAILFRWMATSGVSTYVVTVEDYLGNELYRAETSDTVVVWHDPELEPEAVYSWRLADAANPRNAYGASFHRLSVARSQEVRTGAEAIRSELGEDNPALPLILGMFYADNGCYGRAADIFIRASLEDEEHGGTYRALACEQYLYNMFVPVEEGLRICEEQ